MSNVSVNSSVTLPCNITRGDSVSWLYIRTDTAQQFKVYGGDQVTDKFTGKIRDATDRANGNYSLLLVDAQTEDSGWYVCTSEIVASKTNRTIASKHIIGLNVSGKCQHCYYMQQNFKQ
jgi:hypothetical protein